MPRGDDVTIKEIFTLKHRIDFSKGGYFSELIKNGAQALKSKKITAECCIHHLWFNDSKYSEKKSLIKWNPAVKSEDDRKALIKAINENGEFYGVKAFAPDGKLNEVKGIKIFERKVEMKIQGNPVYAHLKAISVV